MKYSLLILLFLAACHQHVSFKHTAPDTTQTAALFLLPNGVLNGAIVYRIMHDSLLLDTSNKNNPKLTWARDTIYYVPEVQPLFDSAQHPVIDSITKQQKTTVQFIKTDKKNILTDFNRSLKY